MKEKSTSLVLRFNRNQQFILLSLAMAVRLPAQRESPRFFLASRSQVSWPQLSHKEVRKDSCTKDGPGWTFKYSRICNPHRPTRCKSWKKSFNRAVPAWCLPFQSEDGSCLTTSWIWTLGTWQHTTCWVQGFRKKNIPHQGTWTYPFGWALVWKSK